MDNNPMKSWPEWPIDMRNDHVLLTPCNADGWPSLWRVQAKGTITWLSVGQLVFGPAQVQMVPVAGYAAAIVPASSIVAVVTQPPKKMVEHITWDDALEHLRARQREMARQQAGPGILVPRC